MSVPQSRALTDPIVPTFFSYAVASMLGLVAITTMNIVDGAVVGNFLGGDALAAIALLLPYFTVLVALALMLAVGGSVSVGAHLARGEKARANSIFARTLLATLLLSTLCAVLSLAYEPTLFSCLNVPAELTPLVREYFSVIRWVLVVQLTTMVLYYFVRADDHPFLATASLVAASLTNIALDIVFVTVLDLGLRGSAYGTALAQLVQLGLLATYLRSARRSLRCVFRGTSLTEFFSAAYAGVSELINELSGGLLVWLVTARVLSRMGVDGVAAYGVVNFIVFMSLMLSYGIGDAVHLLVSQSYGAGDRGRIQGFTRPAFACALVIGSSLAVALSIFRESVVRWFLSARDEGVAASAVAFAAVLWPMFIVNTSNVIFSCYLTAVQKPTAAATVALLRGLLLPVAFLFGLDALQTGTHWGRDLPGELLLLALPLAEWVAFGVGGLLFLRHRPRALELSPAAGGDGAFHQLRLS